MPHLLFVVSGGIRMTGSILLRQPFWPCWRRQLDGKQRLVNPTSAGANLTSACGTPSIQVLSSSTIFLRNFHDHRLGSCLQPCTFEYHQSILQLQHFLMAFPWDGSCKLLYPLVLLYQGLWKVSYLHLHMLLFAASKLCTTNPQSLFAPMRP